MRVPQVSERYTYTSERLLREVWDQANAQVRRRLTGGEVSITLPVGSIKAGGSLGDDQPNVFRLAEFACQALRNRIVPVSAATEGKYLQIVFDEPDRELRCYRLPVAGMPTRVAWIYGTYDDPAAGLTLVGLCGSINNYLGAVAERPSPGTGPQEIWYPSSLAGLRKIFAARAEDEAVKDLTNLRHDEQTENPISTALRMTLLGERYIFDQGPREVFAEILVAGPASPNEHGYDTVILGAPLWIRHAPARLVRTEHPVSTEPQTNQLTITRAQIVEVAGAVIAGIGGLLAILGSLLSWRITVNSVIGVSSAAGVSGGDGKLTFLMGAVTVLIAATRLAWPRTPNAIKVSPIACGVFIGVVAAANLWSIHSTEAVSDSAASVTTAGPGLWMLSAGAILAVVGGILSPSAFKS